MYNASRTRKISINILHMTKVCETLSENHTIYVCWGEHFIKLRHKSASLHFRISLSDILGFLTKNVRGIRKENIFQINIRSSKSAQHLHLLRTTCIRIIDSPFTLNSYRSHSTRFAYSCIPFVSLIPTQDFAKVTTKLSIHI